MKKYLEIDYSPITYGESPSLVLLTTIDQDGDKKVKAIATGFIAVCKPYVVLVTAAHAFQGLNGQPVLAVGPIGNVSLAKAKVVTSDRFDIAIIVLETDDLLSLFEKCRCIPVSVLSDVKDSGVDALYQMHGYPAAKNEFTRIGGMKSFQLRVSLGAHRGIPSRSAYAQLDASPFCFDISPKDLINDDLERDLRFGSFKGLSGSPVFRHPIRTEKSEAHLFGMFIEWHKESKTAVVVPWVEIERLIPIAINM
jgi:hypothetical protein